MALRIDGFFVVGNAMILCSLTLSRVAYTVFPDYILLFQLHNDFRTWPILLYFLLNVVLPFTILDISAKPRLNNLLLDSRGILDRYNVVR